MREREIAVAEGVQAPQAASARYLSRRRRVVAEELEMEPDGLEDEEVLVSGQDPMEGRLASESEFDDEQEEGA
jgi:hypothetical protein